MKKSIITDNGVAILSFFFKSSQLEGLAKEFRALPKEEREAFLEKYKDQEFSIFRELSSIEIISRSPSSTFILTEADLEEIKKVSDEVRGMGGATETLDGYLFS